MKREFTVLGENFESWKEIFAEWGWSIVKFVFRLSVFLVAVYALVQFVRWSWEHPISLIH